MHYADIMGFRATQSGSKALASAGLVTSDGDSECPSLMWTVVQSSPAQWELWWVLSAVAGEAQTLSALVTEAASPEGGAAHVVAFCG